MDDLKPQFGLNCYKVIKAVDGGYVIMGDKRQLKTCLNLRTVCIWLAREFGDVGLLLDLEDLIT